MALTPGAVLLLLLLLLLRHEAVSPYLHGTGRSGHPQHRRVVDGLHHVRLLLLMLLMKVVGQPPGRPLGDVLLLLLIVAHDVERLLLLPEKGEQVMIFVGMLGC